MTSSSSPQSRFVGERWCCCGAGEHFEIHWGGARWPYRGGTGTLSRRPVLENAQVCLLLWKMLRIPGWFSGLTKYAQRLDAVSFHQRVSSIFSPKGFTGERSKIICLCLSSIESRLWLTLTLAGIIVLIFHMPRHILLGIVHPTRQSLALEQHSGWEAVLRQNIVCFPN